jgi:maltose alpha-D-glucosyltransferase/alpha-amylase
MPKRKQEPLLGEDPEWYKDAIVYEVHVRAFRDSAGDGIGDLPGLTEKLDYLQDLGVTAVWLLPFYPSPLKDDGYDIADYYTINPLYGTLRDFRNFLDEAHARGLRVITELVVNHTSDQHPWFQRSRRAAPGTTWRNFYVWSDSPSKYAEARIIFKDFETSNWSWDPIAKAYFWHRFYSHQPDLNYDNPQVHREIIRVMDFWLDLGVDGLRLDAVPYLYEREGTSCENLPETHGFLKALRQHVDARYKDRMLLAEANQWPEDAVSYFGSGQGDECHMAFHFPLMPRLFMAVRMEDRMPIVDILEQTPAIPQTSQWAMFLRNHDELTLEMVTDEERDYMYRVYAHDQRSRINLGIRRRLAPLLGNDRRRIELMNFLLLACPGTPFLYYGDELGMGDNIYLGDRNGVRTPMQWSSDKNAGFSSASPQALYLPITLDPEYHYEAVNVEAQRQNPHSLWWWTKRALTLRKRYKAFSRGSIQFLAPSNRKVLAFVRRYGEETLLIVANLARTAQPCELDLGEFKGLSPLELYGHARFPPVGSAPYVLSLPPHAAFCFVLERVGTAQKVASPAPLVVETDWREVMQPPLVAAFESCVASYLRSRPWFTRSGRDMRNLQLGDYLFLEAGTRVHTILWLDVDYVEGDPESYLLPVYYEAPREPKEAGEPPAEFIIAQVATGDRAESGILFEASVDPDFYNDLIESIARRKTLRGRKGDLRSQATLALRQMQSLPALPRGSPPAITGESRQYVFVGEAFLLKLLRKVEPGIDPDQEISRFLSERGFKYFVPTAATLTYFQRQKAGFAGERQRTTAAVLKHVTPGARKAWDYTLDALGRYFERVRTSPPLALTDTQVTGQSLVQLASLSPPENVPPLIGSYLQSADLLGKITAELHLALASAPDLPDFAPEPFTPFYQRSLFQSMRNQVGHNLGLLRQNLRSLPEADQPLGEKVLKAQEEMFFRLRAVHGSPIRTQRIRCHGNFHLGYLLHTGRDFVVVDFEGEVTRPVSERRIKRSVLRDVAAMIRSFDYAAHTGIRQQIELGTMRPEEVRAYDTWAALWSRWIAATYLRGYRAALGGSDLLPQQEQHLEILLEAHLLEKAATELGYELTNHPERARVPLIGLLALLKSHAHQSSSIE